MLPAALRLLDAQRLTPWVLGGLNHGLWALAYGLAALLLAAVLAFSAYRLGWETTILSPQTLQEIARTLAWLPAALGLPAQVPADAEAPGASQALGWWLISGTLVYGALPRLLLLVLCVAVTLSRSRSLPLDLQDPYHRRLISRFELLAPTQVIDSERAVQPRHHDAAAAAADVGALAVIGFELPPELSAPAPLLAQAAWTQRIDGGSDERQALLQRLAATPPARLIVVCHAPSTPDRGTLRFLDGLRAGAIALLLVAPPAQADTGAARWRDWLQPTRAAATCRSSPTPRPRCAGAVPPMAEPIGIAVVGHTNAGKTSLLRTLTRRRDFGEVSPRPGTTRHVESVDLTRRRRAARSASSTRPAWRTRSRCSTHLDPLHADMTPPQRVRAFLASPSRAAELRAGGQGAAQPARHRRRVLRDRLPRAGAGRSSAARWRSSPPAASRCCRCSTSCATRRRARRSGARCWPTSRCTRRRASTRWRPSRRAGAAVREPADAVAAARRALLRTVAEFLEAERADRHEVGLRLIADRC